MHQKGGVNEVFQTTDGKGEKRLKKTISDTQ